MSIKRANASSVTKSGSAISDVPDAPTGLTATDAGDGTTASVSFTPAVTGGGSITSYTVTSSPGGFTGTGASSPISVTGLTAGTAYTFTATATNASGTSSASTASGSLTLASVGNYFLIQEVTQAYGSSSTMIFSSIPQTYKHLQIRVSTTTSGAYQPDMKFNGDGTNTNYVTQHYISGNGTSATSGAITPADGVYIGMYLSVGTISNQNYPWMMIIDIPEYTNTSKYKTTRAITGQDKNGSGQVNFMSGLWMSTAAITQVSLNAYGVYPEGYYALYGVK